MPSRPSGQGSRKQRTAIRSEEGKVTGNALLGACSTWRSAAFSAERVNCTADHVLNFTSQRTQTVYFTKTNGLMLCTKLFSVYCQNYAGLVKTAQGRTSKFQKCSVKNQTTADCQQHGDSTSWSAAVGLH